jgi:TIR domain
MKIFLSYSSEDRLMAEEIHLALTGVGHDVFFDRSNLAPAGEYHGRLKLAVQDADALVFLVSPSAVRPGSYTLSELKFAREKWPHPKGFVLPVVIRPIDWNDVPAYLKTVTVLQPEGNAAAETVDAIDQLASDQAHAPLAFTRMSDNEVIVTAQADAAIECIRASLSRLGRVTSVDAALQIVEGKVRVGLSSARLRMVVTPLDRARTRIVVQPAGGGDWGFASRNASRRLLDTLSNLTNPGYSVNRRGARRAALLALALTLVVAVAFTLILFVRQAAR